MTGRLDVPTRRGFLAGIGAAIVVAKAATITMPIVGPVRSIARTLPPIELRIHPKWPGGYATYEYIFAVLRDVGEQVVALGPLTTDERATVADQIDAVIDSARPIAYLIEVEAPLEAIAAGRFEIRETGIGRAVIREVAAA